MPREGLVADLDAFLHEEGFSPRPPHCFSHESVRPA